MKQTSGTSGLGLLLVAFTLSISWGVLPFSWHDQQRVAELGLLAGLAVLVWWLPLKRLPRNALLLLWSALGLGVLSAGLALYPLWALREWALVAGLAVLALALAVTRCHRAIYLMLFLLVGFNSYQFIVNYISAYVSGMGIVKTDLLFSGFSNPRFLNQFQVLFMPLMAWWVSVNRHAAVRHKRQLAGILFVVLVLQWCIAFMLAGRGMYAGLVVAHVVLLVLFPRFRRLLYIQLIAAGLGLVLYLGLFVVLPEWLGTGPALRDNLRFGLSRRDVLWQLAWDTFRSHPWLGIGPMHLATPVNPVATHPHQVVLQWLAEWGVLATLAATALATWGMWHGLRFVRSHRATSEDAALWVALAASLVLAQVDGVFVMPYTQVWMAVFVGLALGRWQFSGKHSEENSALWTHQRVVWRLLMVPVLIVSAHTLMTDVPQLGGIVTEQGQTSFHPRFWSNGWIPHAGLPDASAE